MSLVSETPTKIGSLGPGHTSDEPASVSVDGRHDLHSAQVQPREGATRTWNNRRKPRIQKEPRQALQKATIFQLAQDASMERADAPVDIAVIQRIKKCLDRANHPNTPEAEVKAALRMSSRLMTEHNVTNADILAQASTAEEQANLGGESTVRISRTTPGSGRVYMQNWVVPLVDAITIFFDCKDFSVARWDSIDWVFYGVIQNTITAASAFEMAHNLILEWARTKKKVSANNFCFGAADGLVKIAKKEKRQEKRAVEKREKKAQETRIKEELQQRERELERLKPLNEETLETYAGPSAEDIDEATSKPPTGLLRHDTDDRSNKASFMPDFGDGSLTFDADSDDGSDGDSDDSDDNDDYSDHSSSDGRDDDSGVEPDFKVEDEVPIDLAADFDDELEKIVKREEVESPVLPPILPAVQTEPIIKIEGMGVDNDEALNVHDASATLVRSWQSSQQLVLFRHRAQAVAEEYLKSKNVKLKSTGTYTRKIRDWDAYNEGKEAAKDIDVKRRNIKAA